MKKKGKTAWSGGDYVALDVNANSHYYGSGSERAWHGKRSTSMQRGATSEFSTFGNTQTQTLKYFIVTVTNTENCFRSNKNYHALRMRFKMAGERVLLPPSLDLIARDTPSAHKAHPCFDVAQAHSTRSPPSKSRERSHEPDLSRVLCQEIAKFEAWLCEITQFLCSFLAFSP